MTDEAAGAAEPATTPDPVLPESVRQRVVALAAERLGELAPGDVPASLRRVARFTPSKRARLAEVAVASAVDSDAVFRNAVAESVRAALPELVAALAAGTTPAAADPADVAAAAYLLRTPGWQQLVAAAAAEEAMARSTESNSERDAELARITGQLEEARALARTDRAAQQVKATAVAGQLEELRRSLRQATEAQRRAEQARLTGDTERAALQAAAQRVEATTASEMRRVRARVTELETQLESARKVGRGIRGAGDVRLWLLLDSVTNAAAGLRRELALPPATSHPADEVAAGLARAAAAPAALGLAREDPAWLDAILAVPGTHLLVDGYNVTKTGFPDVSLEAQRVRLVQGLAALAARTAAEVTVVFDGAERTGPLGAPSGRGVRVLFSPAGRPADDVLVQLVRAEPTGRSIAIVTADREVITRAEYAGARGVPPVALLGLLRRT